MTSLATRTDDRAPYEKQRGESAAAWQAFLLYRDADPPRTIRKAAERATEGTRRNVETVYSQFKKWATKFAWTDRADAYDVEMDRRYRAQRETEAAQARRFERATALAVLRRVNQRIHGDEGGGVDALDWNETSLGEVTAALRTAVQIRRLSDGEATDVIKGAVSVSLAEHERHLTGVIEILLPFIPEERRPGAILALEEYAASAAGR